MAVVNPGMGDDTHCLCATHYGYFCDYYELDEDNRPQVRYLKFRPPGSE